MRTRIDRRAFLSSAGVALALPALDLMSDAALGAESTPPKKMVFICTSLGLHAPFLFPEKAGTDYELTPYLEHLKDHRERFTLFSGLSHPDQAGADGHSSQMTWLTAARHPGLGGFRNSVSVDQFAREKLGNVTRFPSITLSTAGQTSQSYTRGGVMIPAQSRPSDLFSKMFLQGKPSEIERQKRKLQDGRSILDALSEQTKSLGRRISVADRDRLGQFYESIRQTERRLSKANQWLDRPKPKVNAEEPKDVTNESDLIGRMRLLLDLVPLAVQTDSTRIITVLINGRNDVPPVPGVSIDHHNLSHHGQDETKIKQLQRVETEIMKSFGDLLGSLTEKKEPNASSLLDSTMVTFGSNLGNANAHDWRNLPVIMAGGGLTHGRHVAFDKEDNKPFCNLFVTMLQQMGIETDEFGSSNGSLDWTT